MSFQHQIGRDPMILTAVVTGRAEVEAHMKRNRPIRTNAILNRGDLSVKRMADFMVGWSDL